jgi:DNA-binding CsgD family transcriptional regulator
MVGFGLRRADAGAIMLNMFSALLCELFQAAETMPPESYACEILRLLCKALSCDMALLGEGPARLNGCLPTGRLALHACPAALFPALCASARHGSLEGGVGAAPAGGRGRGGVLALSSRGVLPQRLRDVGVAELVFASTAADAEQPRTWLALLRTPGRHACAADAALVAALWPHLLRALDLNRHRALEACIARTSAVGHALLGADYAMVACDPAFRAMRAREWPGLPASDFPEHVRLSLSESGRHEGTTLSLEMRGGGDCLLCLSRAHGMAGSLTPAERKVAMHYARGSSSREIAQVLSVSENTVRTHLAHIFDKMGIHRKVDLMRRLVSG